MAAKKSFVPKHILRKKQDLKDWKSQNKGWLEELKRQGEIGRRMRDEVFPKQKFISHDEAMRQLAALLG